MSDTHVCPHCEVEKESAQFQLYKGRPNGWCRSCRTQKERDRRIAKGVMPRKQSVIDDDKKLCLHCLQMKSLSEFSKSKRGLGGVSSYCKPCFANKVRNAEVSRQRTRKYRKVNRERHLANHRVRMFEYRTRKRVTQKSIAITAFNTQSEIRGLRIMLHRLHLAENTALQIWQWRVGHVIAAKGIYPKQNS